jgi:3-hydroxyacyl-[acyl-carrier-protein] dehydratase
MRWFWIDRFEKFIVGKEATSLKNVTLGEEPLDDYLPGYPHFPHSLMIEGMAQTGGLLISQIQDFTQRIVLAKVSKAHFHDIARPGDQLRLNAKILSLHSDGAIVEGIIDVGPKRLADMELTFAILDESWGESSFFMPGDLCRILRSLCLFDVVVHENGTRPPIPKYMLEAEIAELPKISNPP